MTVTILQPDEATSKDTWVELVGGGSASTGALFFGNYNDGDEIPIDYDYRMYLEFDLTGITDPVASAVLSLYRTKSTYGYAPTAEVKAVTSAWIETMSAAGIPTNEASVSASTIVTAGGSTGWFTWDITSLVNRWIQGTLVNRGFVIVANGQSTGMDEYHSFESSAATNSTLRPQLALTLGGGVVNVSPIIISASNVVAAFNAIPAPLTAPIIIIASTSSMSTAFMAIPLAYINPAIVSNSQVAAALEALAIMELNASFASISVVRVTIKLVIPEFLILRGHVSIAGTPIPDAFVRAIADDGSKVYSSTSDTFGNYEVAVDTSGVYHVICYKRDIDGSIFSSVAHPFIEVINPAEVGP